MLHFIFLASGQCKLILNMHDMAYSGGMVGACEWMPPRETVAVFEAATDFEDAIDELMCSGFDRADLSVVASDKRVEEKLGHIYRTVAELEDDGTVPRSSYVAPESIHEAEGALVGGPFYVGAVAAIAFVLDYGGSLAAEIDGALLAGAAGGLIGFLFAKSIGNRHLRHQREQLARGGLLLWVADTRCSTHEARR